MQAKVMTGDFELKLSKPDRVMTRYGLRWVQSSSGVTEQFWAAWRERKDGLKKEGYSVSKDQSGKWKVSIWREYRAETVETNGRTKDTSREKPWLDPVFLAQEGSPPWDVDTDEGKLTAYDLAYQRSSRGR